MRIRKLIYLLGFFLCLISLVACQKKIQKSSEHNNGLKIVTSFYPIYAMVRDISGDLNDVRMIQSQSGIHSFEPSVNDIKAIYDADVFVYHSHTLESWAGKLDPTLEDSKVKVIEASVGMELQKVTGLEDVEATDGIDPATLYDPHTWLDPVLVGQEANLIAKQLAKVDEKHANVYKANAKKLQEKANQLSDKYIKAFKKTKNKTFVTQHTAFAYTAKRFGLSQLGIASVSNEEPSPRQLAEIRDFVKNYKVKTIFVEKGVSQKLAKSLATSTGVSLKELNPLEGDPENNLTYLENLNKDFKTLLNELEK
ncbi:MAG: zinc ABC transporter substrate-binding protein [Streptococcus sp.]|nr:zinc ABC transporter substrate-binding protein [Streptococcus sp.]